MNSETPTSSQEESKAQPTKAPYIPWIRPPPPVLKHAAYFEGILQLRNTLPEVAQWVKDQTRRDNKSLIPKERRVPGGVDFYFSDQHYLQALGKKMQIRWNGEYLVSYTLHTLSHVTSKELYRVTILFKMNQLRKGDIVNVLDRKVAVVQISKQIITKDVKSGKKERWKPSELERYAKMNSE